MPTINEVYRQIKDMSSEAWNPRPQIEIANIVQRMHSTRETLLPLLSELNDMKLIRFNETSKVSVRLTLLGNNVTRTKQ